MTDHITISKDPKLEVSEDFNLLRKLSLQYIEKLGTKYWTDYNIHDPGITLLELLCYAITDLGHRTSFDIKDILAPAPGEKYNPAQQAFFTAREILTINPWTADDYRKLLIDIEGIKNAWLFCKKNPCNNIRLYANCAKSILQYQPATEHAILIRGLFDVLIEFEDEEGIGDLNSGKIKYSFGFDKGSTLTDYTTAVMEMRLPSWHDVEENQAKFKSFRNSNSFIKQVTVKFISGNKGDNQNIPQNELARALRRPIYATIDVLFHPDKADIGITETLALEDVPFTLWFRSESDRKAMQLNDLKNAIEDQSASGIISKYAEKIKKADEIITQTYSSLHQTRNLCEDFCSIKAIQIEDIAICADMDLSPDADIEQVLATAYYLIDQYLSPDIKFYSLKELLDKETPSDEIFDGPALSNGFINNDQLAATQLKTKLYTSDIINLLMDIPAVSAIRNLVLVRYDKEGYRVQSDPWQMAISDQHQPRLYIEGSKFLVFKNGLPFLPDKLELSDTLQVIKGANAQPKFSVAEIDLLIPQGTYYPLKEYSSIQNLLPLTYGIGKEGLPPHVSEARRSQAKQLKAYLLFFEQMLVNYLEQISHVKDLFALDSTIRSSYFSKLITDTPDREINGIIELYAPVDGLVLTPELLNSFLENRATFTDRRNRFLDQLMSRFAEQFTDYALMLYSYSGSKKIADEQLIKDKISFINDVPFMSRSRAKSFNYKDETMVCASGNVAGLQKRIERLLGLKHFDNYFEYYEETDLDTKLYERRWRLVDETGKIYISGSTRYYDPDFLHAQQKAGTEAGEVLQHITNEAFYEIRQVKKWVVNLKGPTGETIATRKQSFNTRQEAELARDEIIGFAKMIILAEKIFIVEHLLLRPQNTPNAVFPQGDPLLSICIPTSCNVCGEEDPYSFRFTIVMNGETGLANEGIAFRRFAENTIRMEIPAHLGLKICWVSTAQLEIFGPLYRAWLTELAKKERDPLTLHNKMRQLLDEFIKLKSVYPKASLHDCIDGNDENRIFLNQTIV